MNIFRYGNTFVSPLTLRITITDTSFQKAPISLKYTLLHSQAFALYQRHPHFLKQLALSIISACRRFKTEGYDNSAIASVS